MPATREEAFAYFKDALANKAADDPLVLDLVSQLNRDAQQVHAAIFHIGFSRGEEKGAKKGGEKVPELEAERDRVKAELAAATTKIADLERRSPDAAAQARQYEDRLREKETAWGEEKGKLTGALKAERASRAQAQFEARAKDAGLLVPYARTMWRDAEGAGRIAFADDGRLEIHEPNRSIPYSVTASDRAAYDAAMIGLFVEEVKKAADPSMIVSNGDRGSDTAGDRGASGKTLADRLVPAFQAQRDAKVNPLAPKVMAPVVSPQQGTPQQAGR